MWKYLVLVAVMACGGGDDGPSFADQHPRIYMSANKDRLAAALTAKSPAAMKFQSIVDRWVGGEDVYGFYAWNAALMGQLTGDAKYCTAAVAAVDKKVAAEEATIAAGGMPEVASGDYYPAGDDIGDLALVYDWCYSAIDGGRRDAWLAYANQAVTNIWDPDHATWGGKPMPWTGWAIDNPANNYYYNFLRATMLLGLAAHGEHDGIEAWLAEFHDTKLMGELVPMFDADLVGGGSREGTGYGVSMRRLWELYDLWTASTGEELATKTPHTRASMLFFIHETLPTLDRVAPTGDQSRDSTASFFDYHRNYLQELVTLFHDDPLAPKVQALLAGCSIPEMTEPFMYGYDFLYGSDIAPTTLDGINTAFYAPGTGQMFARSGWDKHATWINMNAGPYTETHAHQDQGALMIFKDGWLAYDPVVDSHSGLTQDVDVHGTLRFVNGGSPVKQMTGTSATLLALHQGTGYVHVAADLAPVYGGAVGKLQREIIYLEPDTVVIYDRATSSGGSQVWSLAFPAQPQLAGSTATVQASGHTLTVQRVSDNGASSSVHSFSSDSDFAGGYRLDETATGGAQAWLHVAYVDGGVTTVTAVDGNTVDLVLAGGKAAHVAFDAAGIGASLTLAGATVTLGAGVDSLPE